MINTSVDYENVKWSFVGSYFGFVWKDITFWLSTNIGEESSYKIANLSQQLLLLGALNEKNDFVESEKVKILLVILIVIIVGLEEWKFEWKQSFSS